MRESFAERIARRERERGAEQPPPPPPLPAEVSPQVSALHRAVADLFEEVLGVASEGTNDSTPQAAQIIMRMLQANRGMIYGSLAKVPADRLETMLRQLRDKLDGALAVTDE